MKCNDYIEKITLKNGLHELTQIEVQHYSNCKECREKSDKYFALFSSIEKKKKLKVDENISTLIIDKIQKENKPYILRNEILKYAAVIIVSLIIGSVSSLLVVNNYYISIEEELISGYFDNEENDFYVESIWMGLNDFDND